MSTPGETAGPASGYLFPPSVAESERLERQGAELYGGGEVLTQFLTSAVRDVLDVGCGSGFFTRHVATALPAARVCGVDLDASRIAFARTQRRAPNTDFVEGDMAALPFADDRFDLVFARFALGHQREPTAALAEMARVTRPGGVVVAYDMVHEGVWLVPDRPAFAEALRAVVGALRERGAEPNQGLFLAAGLRRVGLVEVTAKVISHQATAGEPIYAAHRDNWIATLHYLAPQLGDRLEASRLQAALDELDRRDGDELLVETTVLAWGQKR